MAEELDKYEEDVDRIIDTGKEKGYLTYGEVNDLLPGEITSPDELDEGDFRRYGPRFTGENLKQNTELVARLRELASEKGVTPGQLALAWVLHRGEHIVPIPGTKRVSYLEENLGAAAVELTSDDLREIETAASRITVQGARYPEHLEKLTGR